MTKKRRYLISGAVLAACVYLALGVLAMLSQAGLTIEQFDRIKMGMTRGEVEAIVGPLSEHGISCGWLADGKSYWAQITFDDNNRVARKTFGWSPDDRSTLEWLLDKTPWFKSDFRRGVSRI